MSHHFALHSDAPPRCVAVLLLHRVALHSDAPPLCGVTAPPRYGSCSATARCLSLALSSGVSADGNCPGNVFEPDWPATAPSVTAVVRCRGPALCSVPPHTLRLPDQGGTHLGLLETGTERTWSDGGGGFRLVLRLLLVAWRLRSSPLRAATCLRALCTSRRRWPTTSASTASRCPLSRLAGGLAVRVTDQSPSTGTRLAALYVPSSTSAAQLTLCGSTPTWPRSRWASWWWWTASRSPSTAPGTAVSCVRPR